MNDIQLEGCTPEPLMNYLKALGVFRLVAEQADPNARLSWRGGFACLHTKLCRNELTTFFLDEYRPTPIVVPWSGSDFFGVNWAGDPGPYKNSPTASKIIEAILATTSARLAHYREAIHTVLTTMQDCQVRVKADITGASRKAAKSDFIARLRGRIPEDLVYWIDATSQVDDGSSIFNPLMGSGGGNDGNTHFSDNFMQNLWDCLPDFDAQHEKIGEERPSAAHALFNEMSGKLVERTGALFDSGAVGGPNATQGMRRGFVIDPWNFVLAIEGCLAFAGGLSKRLGANSTQSPSFPFLARMTAAGFGSSVLKEYGQYEVWLPTWEREWTYGEHQYFMREGRVQLGRRSARSGMDYARSVSTLGVSTGVSEFRRCGLIRGRVGGDNYFTAAMLGTFRVHNDSSVSLLEQIDPWLRKFELAIQDDKVPARYRSAFNRLDRAITEMCRGSQSKPLLPIVREIGNVERILSTSLAFAQKKFIKPFSGLSSQWLDQADDGSPEFRLAASLAGIQATKKREVGPLRAFLEEVEVTKFVNWSPGSTSAVWSKQPLAANLAAVFRRRQMEAFREGIAGVPLCSPRPASLDDVVAFLNEETDDEKLGDLLWGLIAVEYAGEWRRPERGEIDIPFEFGVPRLLVQEKLFAANGEYWNLTKGEPNARPNPDVFHKLASGRSDAVSDCVTRAARRLKSGGLLVNGYRNRGHSGQRISVASPVTSERLLAAMLFPLSDHDLERIANSVLYPPESEE